MNIRQLTTESTQFWAELDALLAWESVSDDAVFNTVNTVLKQVKQQGDAAVLQFTEQFDHLTAQSMSDLELPKQRLKHAFDALADETKQALETSAKRVKDYAQHQIMESWQYREADGTVLGQKITPLDKAGLYVPGGKAAYPSSVLMNAIPAKVAGVNELIMVVPSPNGELNDLVLAAAYVSNVDRIFTVGGAQAVAALAYGTETIPQVDKIVGPGNIYVATAKKMVFGTVGIDMVAGPSEILIVCDGKTDPDWIAMDLFSQAEHDEDAQSILISDDSEFLQQVSESVARLIEEMPRKDIIVTSLLNRGAFILVKDMQQATEVANYIAPEHLELSVEDPDTMLQNIKHAGAVFMGRFTPEALGDYCAGPNHVLPTSRTARFSSPLGVYDFQKRSSIINCSAQGSSELAKTASVMAHGEGLIAHARSAEYRIKQ